ncbi:hypothetical protein J2792_000419 [Novosphingobium capsulatum]|uniref:Uncharacterized protein n=1 Tax=Novosphingobium capsulatum TaxID=13688 RepID=A0ABU1MGX8_9SPHN|nr:hypothetical protein [Novosphingobium capsulatum]MDR6509579.1 hypothetical protein [Novosphingobium capsulatum]
MPQSDPSSIYEIVSSISTAVAAIFAAGSTWLARKSAKSAQDAVDEARLARRNEILPRFVLDKDFLDFSFHWPHGATLNGEPVYLARKHSKDLDPSSPTFTLSNVGERPALELTVTFELVDHNKPLAVPQPYHQIGLTSGPEPTLPGEPSIPTLQYLNANGTGGGSLPLYRKQSVFLANCVPGKPNTIELPQGILSRLFVRGLEYINHDSDHSDLILIVKVEGFTVDGEAIANQFRFHVYPFCYGPSLPLRVSGHIRELPTYPSDRDALRAVY